MVAPVSKFPASEVPDQGPIPSRSRVCVFVDYCTALSVARPVVLKIVWFAAHCKIYTNLLSHFGYKIKNILIYLYLVSEEIPNSHRYDVENTIKMDKAKILAAHLATSCGAAFGNH
jgi:hypothetical protein